MPKSSAAGQVSMDRDSLKRHLEFYRDLGIRQLNIPAGALPAERRTVAVEPPARTTPAATPSPVAARVLPTPPRPAANLMPANAIPALPPVAPPDDTLQK